MKKNILNIIAINALLITLSGSLNAQSSITGIVKTGPKGFPLRGATVTIIETSSTTTTGSLGEYTIGVATGTTRTISVSGYSGSARTIVVGSGINRVDFWFDAVVDIDGNTYGGIEIGSQVWMTENLVTTKINDGTAIPSVKPSDDWSTLTTPVYCQPFAPPPPYPFGNYYNWYAVSTGKLCPTGWHVPSNYDWNALTTYLGGSDAAGGKLKEAGTLHWVSPNTGATNESGFTSIAGGYIQSGTGGISATNEYGMFYSFSEENINSAYVYDMFNNTSQAYLAYYNKIDCHNVRCVKDYLITVGTTSITQNSALSGGNITDDGGAAITVRGVCWNTSSNPTILDNHTTDGSGTGRFTSSLTGLSPNRIYYLRAYATNSVGTSYGDLISFATFKPDAITDNEGNYYNIVTIGSQVWMAENLRVKHYNNGESIGTTNPAVLDISSETYPKYQWSYSEALLVWTVQVQPLILSGAGGMTITQIVSAGGLPSAQGTILENWATSLSIPNVHNTTIQTISDECKEISALLPESCGLLYTWFAVADSRNVCPSGWHVPGYEELITLTDYLGGNNVAGGKLKETGYTHWYSPNSGASNQTGFTALPGDPRFSNGEFSDFGRYGYWWSLTDSLPPYAKTLGLFFSNNTAETNAKNKTGGLSVRCIKYAAPISNTFAATGVASTNAILYATVNANGANTDVTFEYGKDENYGKTITATPSPVTRTVKDTVRANISGLSENTTYHFRVKAVNAGGTTYGDDLTFTTSSKVTDIDGNSYNTVKIGNQLWFQENLKVLHYRNGDVIPNATNWAALSNSTNGAYCNYDNDASNGNLYGRLYNAYATVDNRNLCPTGFHIPTEYEWIVLENYLIANGYNYDGSNTGNEIAKAMASESGWRASTNEGAVGNNDYPIYRNKSGFTGLPAGFVYPDPGFQFINAGAVWWSTTERIPSLTVTYSLWSDWVNSTHNDGDLKVFGFSVRCLQGEPIVVTNVKDDGPGSLRAAIVYANTNPGPDIIKFNIPGTGPFTIKPLSSLPAIKDPVVIDGYSQPGTSSATSTLLIQLDGTTSGAGSNGLTIDVSNCTVEGLIITKFPLNGIQIASGAGNWIRANSIYNNGRRGIALSGSVNNNQSFPVLDKTVINQGNIYINGKLNSTPGKNFTLDFFASKLADSTGFGEGQNYLGSATVSTGGDGMVIFRDSILSYKTIYGDVITATATDPDRNTSEFSKAVGGLPDQKLNNLAFNYYVNPNDVPNANPDAIVNAVKASFNTWNGVTTASIAFNYVNKTTEKYAHIDGENIISFSDDQYEFGDWVLAITAKTLELGATDAETKILDADIIFNPYFVKHQEWNFGIADDMPNVGYFDIQSITTHEIGHILGLLHTGVHNATMWFEMPQGIDARSLEQDDKSWASYKYPSGSASSFGSISGKITYGYDGKPVAGALVLAINTASKDTIHGYSNADGSYLVPGLSAGSYNVYIEPLDGSVRNRPLYPRNISLYIYSNTIYTDYPGEFYSGANEKAQETTDIVTPVTVNTGSATSGIDFVTNKDMIPPVVVAVTPPDLKMSPDIIIKFSEPVDISTFSGTTCYLIKSGDTKSIGGTYRVLSSQTNILLFTPVDALVYSTNYTLHITTGITDLAKIPNNLSAEYQSSFKTGPGDMLPPTIVDIIPDNNAADVFVDQKTMIFFSEPMNKTSVESSLLLNPAANHKLSWDSQSSILTLIPDPNYLEGTNYTLTISTGAKDLSGNAISNSVSFSFTTVTVADPTIKYLGPANNSTAVIVTTPVVVDFSEPIDTNSVKSNNFRLFNSSTGIPVQGKFEFLNDNSRVVFRPYTNLEFSQSYTIALTTGIKDVSQNTGTFEGSTTTFTTATKPSKPSIDFIDPPSDIIGAKVIIGGNGFDPDPTKNIVMFYSKGTSNVQAVIESASLTSLKVIVPAGAESGPIRVTVNGNPDDALSPYDFAVVHEYSDPCNEVTGSAQTGGGSKGVTLDFSGATAYVTNSGSNTVSVIDVASLTTLKTINVGEYPLMIDMSPGGTRAYVTNFRSHTVSVIDLKTNAVIKTINVGYNPYGIKVSPDGKQVYVAHYNSEYENVSVIDADPASGGFDHVVANINTGTRNKDLDVDVNASIIVVTGDDGLKIIERKKTALGFDYSTYSASSGIKTKDAEIVSEAGIAVVSTMDGALLFIDINKGSDSFGAVIASSTTGGKAGDVKPDFSGVFLYVTNPYDNQVSVYKMTYGGGGGSEIGSYQGFKMTEYWKIPVGLSPQGLIINTFNDELFVVNEFGTTGSTGSLTKVKICCAGKSPNEDIVAVALYIQGLINTGVISWTDGKMLISKLNDALGNVARGKTKTAINDLNTFINKVNSSVKTGKIPKGPGQILIDDANAIIAKLNGGTKSAEIKSANSNTVFSNRVQKSESIPVTQLGVIYPNPFCQSVTINYTVAENNEVLTKVQIKVYDENGRLVGTLIDKMMEQGCYTATWKGTYDNGGLIAYGSYFVQFRAGNIVQVRKIILIKTR